jgi:hypothetical protein
MLSLITLGSGRSLRAGVSGGRLTRHFPGSTSINSTIVGRLYCRGDKRHWQTSNRQADLGHRYAPSIGRFSHRNT